MVRRKGAARPRTAPATDLLLGLYHLSEGDSVVGRFLVEDQHGSTVERWYEGVLLYNTEVSTPRFRECTYLIHFSDDEILCYTAEDMMQALSSGKIRKAYDGIITPGFAARRAAAAGAAGAAAGPAAPAGAAARQQVGAAAAAPGPGAGGSRAQPDRRRSRRLEGVNGTGGSVG